jgi:hypothetical protein
VGETSRLLEADELMLDLTAQAPDSLFMWLCLRFFFDTELILVLLGFEWSSYISKMKFTATQGAENRDTSLFFIP